MKILAGIIALCQLAYFYAKQQELKNYFFFMFPSICPIRFIMCKGAKRSAKQQPF